MTRGKYLAKTNKTELFNHFFYWGLLYIFKVKIAFLESDKKIWGQNLMIQSQTSFDLNDLKRA